YGSASRHLLGRDCQRSHAGLVACRSRRSTWKRHGSKQGLPRSLRYSSPEAGDPVEVRGLLGKDGPAGSPGNKPTPPAVRKPPAVGAAPLGAGKEKGRKWTSARSSSMALPLTSLSSAGASQDSLLRSEAQRRAS